MHWTLIDLALLVPAVALWAPILLSRKQPVAMLAWLLGVTFIPIAGPVFYLIFGRTQRLRGLPRRKARSDQAIRRQWEPLAATSPQEPAAPRETAAWRGAVEWPGAPEHLRGALAVADTIGRHPITTGNHLELLRDGRTKYERLIEDIQDARHHVHLEYYILRQDRFGSRLAEVLMDKARAGIEVRLLLDGVGSWSLRRGFIAGLREAGVRFAWFHPINPFRRHWRLNIRNHRKVVVIDGAVGYLGGINLADEYLGRDSRMGEWYDLALRFTGPSVRDLQRVFGEDWHFSTGEVLVAPHYFAATPAGEGGALMQIVNSEPSDDLFTEMHETYFSLLSGARSRAWLVTPYFLPDVTIQHSLARLAMAGVDTRVLVSRHSVEWVVAMASRSFFVPMLETGVRIYRFKPGAILHAKALLVDDTMAVVGSANLDHRSFHINFETGALICDSALAAEVRGYIEARMTESEEVNLEHMRARPGWQRGLEALARLAAPIF